MRCCCHRALAGREGCRERSPNHPLCVARSFVLAHGFSVSRPDCFYAFVSRLLAAPVVMSLFRFFAGGARVFFFRLKVTDYNTQFSGITPEMLKGKAGKQLSDQK